MRSDATGPAKVQALAAPVPPAKVEMIPPVETTRIRLLPESATKTRPSGASNGLEGRVEGGGGGGAAVAGEGRGCPFRRRR